MYSSYFRDTVAAESTSASSVASTVGMVYNPQLSKWESAAGRSQSSLSSNASSLYSKSGPTNIAQPQNRVTVFTAYYHGWKEFVDGKKTLPKDVTIEWASYYADMASRAAHHFYQNPAAADAPFELPPAPPQTSNVLEHKPSSRSSSTSWKSESQYFATSTNRQQHQYLAKITPSTPLHSKPVSYQQYMEKCLAQCGNETERKEMDHKLVVCIQNAMTHGSLLKDWGSEPLILLNRSKSSSVATSPLNLRPSTYDQTGRAVYSSPQTQQNTAGRQQQTSRKRVHTNSYKTGQHSYYGPSATDSGSTMENKTKGTRFHYGDERQTNLNMDHSYYGPSVSSPHSLSTDLKVNRKLTQKKRQKTSNGFDQSQLALDERARRFATSFSITSHNDGSLDRLQENGPVIQGRCQILEKEYLRLTSAPRPELVRPQRILEEHLTNLLAERSKVGSRRDYKWFCSQLKAIRQDLTVQHIRNSFTVRVYEAHARIALEEGDLNEFNQCQTQLKYFYELLKAENSEAVANQDEFVAYRLLYSVLLTQNEKYSGGSSDVSNLLKSLTCHQRQHSAIAFADRVRAAVSEGNFHLFFALLRKDRFDESSGSYGSYLLQQIAPSMRKAALPVIVRAYKPMSVAVDFVLRELGLDEDEKFGKRWLASCGCIFSEDNREILCKDTKICDSNIDERSSLI